MGKRIFEELSVMKLSHIFDVSKESVRVRLKTLELLNDETAKPVKSAKQALAGCGEGM